MTSKQLQTTKSKFLPLTYVLKYDPPMIGMIYKASEKEKKKRIYKIYFHALIYKNDPDIITRQLFLEHALHLNETNVSYDQIKSLVKKLLEWRAERNDNTAGQKKQIFTKQPFEEVDLLGLDEPPQGKAGINIQDFGQTKANHQRGNYQFQHHEEEEDYYRREIGDDNLEFEGEIEDLEHEQNAFDYGKTTQGTKTQPGRANLDFLQNFGNQNIKKEEEMDFILDDAENLDNFSDY